jgi:hypothetical protein
LLEFEAVLLELPGGGAGGDDDVEVLTLALDPVELELNDDTALEELDELGLLAEDEDCEELLFDADELDCEDEDAEEEEQFSIVTSQIT